MKPCPDRPLVNSYATASRAFNVTVNRRFKRWLVIISGWSFVALGVAGLFLPILQGVLFLLIGLTILSTEYVWAHKLLQKLRKRFPSLTSRFDTAKLRAHAWLKRVFPSKSDGV
ncbi:MAG: PGPGW domain-containing protein [Terriglobia bacterium]